LKMKGLYLSILLVIVMATSLFADIPKTLNYQGRLMNTVGQPVIDGDYSVTFRLYTAASGGTMVWEEAQSVQSTNGYFNAVLGSATALTPAMFSQPLWIGMQVGAAAEMIPRQQLGTSAYAMTVVDGAITTSKIKNAAVTTAKIADDAITSDKVGDSQIKGRNISPRIYQRKFNPPEDSGAYLYSIVEALIPGMEIPIQLDYPATLDITFVGQVRNNSGSAWVRIFDGTEVITKTYGPHDIEYGNASISLAYDIEANTSHTIKAKIYTAGGNDVVVDHGILKVICYYQAEGDRTTTAGQ
jgi:hypothetical protein